MMVWVCVGERESTLLPAIARGEGCLWAVSTQTVIRQVNNFLKVYQQDRRRKRALHFFGPDAKKSVLQLLWEGPARCSSFEMPAATLEEDLSEKSGMTPQVAATFANWK
jgi:hypothetical protein